MINIYKPNKNNTGHYFQFNVGVNNNKNKFSSPYAFYVKAVKQYSWSNGKGAFKENGDKPDKSVRIKFNEFEAAAMLNGFENFFEHYPKNEKGQNELTFFHASENDKTSIMLTAAIYNGKKGVFFSVIRNGLKFSLPLNMGECTIIAEYCRFFLNKMSEEYFRRSFETTEIKSAPLKEISSPKILESKDEDDDFLKEEDPFDETPPF